MTALPLLLCGNPSSKDLAGVSLGQLKLSLSNFSAKAAHYLNSDFLDDTTVFGPFCGRIILENGCAALVGRLDPFRIIYLSEFQTQPEYTLAKRVKSGFCWVGDVIPEEKGELWNPEQDVSKISRALFSKHLDQLLWKPALNNLLDYISNNSAPELSDILALDPQNYILSTKGRCLQLYSQLSKGVHWEFFTNILQMDEVTVKGLLRDTFIQMAGLALISHFIPTAYLSIKHDQAVNAYIEIRKAIQ